jgi:predicted Zn-dependent protease with MMP-like domain
MKDTLRSLKGVFMKKRSTRSKGSKRMAKNQSVNLDAVNEQNVDEMLAQLPSAGITDTAFALVEIYESIERSYRAAATAGEVPNRITYSTNS